MTKAEAREKIRAWKKQMSKEENLFKSKEIVKKLVTLPCFLNAKTLYCYVSYNQEVYTRDFMKEAFKLGKEVYVPKVAGRELEFYRIRSLEEVKPGYQGILEPDGSEISDSSEILMILPGLAFDSKKNRVGYGGGFYDRYLASHRNVTFIKTALAFEFQIVDSIEMEDCDEAVDMIVTEKRIL